MTQRDEQQSPGGFFPNTRWSSSRVDLAWWLTFSLFYGQLGVLSLYAGEAFMKFLHHVLHELDKNGTFKLGLAWLI